MGYVVLAPDWRGFGEREDRERWARGGREPCDVGYMAMGYWGYHLLGLHLHDAKLWPSSPYPLFYTSCGVRAVE